MHNVYFVVTPPSTTTPLLNPALAASVPAWPACPRSRGRPPRLTPPRARPAASCVFRGDEEYWNWGGGGMSLQLSVCIHRSQTHTHKTNTSVPPRGLAPVAALPMVGPPVGGVQQLRGGKEAHAQRAESHHPVQPRMHVVERAPPARQDRLAKVIEFGHNLLAQPNVHLHLALGLVVWGGVVVGGGGGVGWVGLGFGWVAGRWSSALHIGGVGLLCWVLVGWCGLGGRRHRIVHITSSSGQGTTCTRTCDDDDDVTYLVHRLLLARISARRLIDRYGPAGRGNRGEGWLCVMCLFVCMCVLFGNWFGVDLEWGSGYRERRCRSVVDVEVDDVRVCNSRRAAHILARVVDKSIDPPLFFCVQQINPRPPTGARRGGWREGAAAVALRGAMPC